MSNEHLAPCPETERRLLAALSPPDGEHANAPALRAAARSLTAFCNLVESPTPLLLEFAEECHALDDGTPLTPRPTALGRFSGRYPIWSVLLSLHQNSPNRLLEGTGAAIADALAAETQVPKGLAQVLLRISKSTDKPSDLRRNESHIADARLRHSLHASAPERKHDLRTALRIAYRNFDEHAGEHRHQCRTSRRTLSDTAYRNTAEVIRKRVESGEPSAAWIAAAAFTGLTLDLTGDLPLCRPDGELDAALDVEEGIFLLDLDILAPRARRPPVSGTGVVPALRVLVRPMPQFLHRALADLQKCHPDAQRLRDLFPGVDHLDTRDLGLEPHPGGFRPSLARFQNTTEAFAVRTGINRVHAAHLSGRHQSTTRSKLYYAAVAREDLWHAATRQFNAMGWGSPTPSRLGPAIGAQAVATPAAVTRWYGWMLSEVETMAPGRRTGFDRLINHHNQYAALTASIISFLLALREVQLIPVFADAPPDVGWISLRDKRVQNAWDRSQKAAPDLVVPLCRAAREQLGCWKRHCTALARRLEKIDAKRAPKLLAYLAAVGRGEHVLALFQIGKSLRPRRLGNQQLSRWWPDWFGMPPNWSRAYWQSTLTAQGISSSAIDILLRHAQAGAEPLISTRSRAAAELIAEVNLAMERHLQELGIRPVRGIVA